MPVRMEMHHQDEAPDSADQHQLTSSTTPSPHQSRTLLHYFTKKSTSSPSANESGTNAVSRQEPQNESNPSHQSQRESLKRKKKGSEEVEAKDEEEDDKKLKEETKDNNDECAGKKPESSKSRKLMSSFFKRLSKEEYDKNLSNKMGSSVVKVDVLVHADEHGTPSTTPTKHPDSPVSKVSCAKRIKTINPSEGIEAIEVIEVIEEKLEGESQEDECDNSTKVQKKISTRLFSKRNKRKQYPDTDKRTEIEVDDNSVDFDFLKVQDPSQTKKKPEIDGNASPKSPQLFKKTAPSKGSTNRRSILIENQVNYDSDSIDVDVLSTITEKKLEEENRHGCQNCKQSHKQSFTALISKPLSQSYAENTISPNEKGTDPASSQTIISIDMETKENASEESLLQGQSSSENCTKNSLSGDNAFTLLMKSAKNKTENSLALKPTDENDDEKRKVMNDEKTDNQTRVKSKRGRKRKVINEQEEEQQEKDVDPKVDEDSSSSRRRSSARISKNKEAMAERQKAQLETEKILNELEQEEKMDSAAKKYKNGGKKRKRNEERIEIEMTNEVKVDEDDDKDEIVVEKIVISSPSKAIKRTNRPLAPIFMKKGEAQKLVKPAEDPEKIAARRAFLMSSAPMSMAVKSKTEKEENACYSSFGLWPLPTTSHVRQINFLQDWQEERGTLKNFKLKAEENEENNLGPRDDVTIMPWLKSAMMNDSDRKNEGNESRPSSGRLTREQIYHLVKSLKILSGDTLPIYRQFRRLVERKLSSETVEEMAMSKDVTIHDLIEEEMMVLRTRRKKNRKKAKVEEKSHAKTEFNPTHYSGMQWTMKYSPKSSEDIIGNQAVVRDLKIWLEEWKKRKRKTKAKSCGRNSNKKRESSFIVSSSDEDDDDDWSMTSDEDDLHSIEGDDELTNTALITGPSGVGKTSSVYAIAQELGFKVLEINASSLRGGRQVLSQLHEATQSHHVHKDHAHEHQPSVQSKLKQKGPLNFGVQKKSLKEEKKQSKSPKRTALILFEDFDVVFEDEDEGFYSAVNSLVSSSKRPIILTSSNPQYFVPRKLLKSEPKQFLFKSISEKKCAQYLQLLALCEGFPVKMSSLQALVSANRGCISRSILDLQFWALSGASGPIQSCKHHAEKKLPALSDDEKEMTVHNLDDSIPPGMLGDNEVADDGDRARSEDQIAKLLSINSNSKKEPVEAVKLQSECCTLLKGLEKVFESGKTHSSSSCLGWLENFTQVQHLWPYGLGNFYERNKALIWPMPRVTKKREGFSKKKTFQAVMKAFKRIRSFDRSVFTTEESDSETKEDDDAMMENAKNEKEPKAAATTTMKFRPTHNDGEMKGRLGTTRKVLEHLWQQADDSSRFLPFSDGQPWWTLPCAQNISSHHCDDDLTAEIASYVHIRSLAKCAKAIEGTMMENEDKLNLDHLTLEDDVDEVSTTFHSHLAAPLSLASPFHDQEVLNAVLPDLTVAPRCHVMDTLPFVRAIARAEEIRKAGGGNKKACRSGRFLHYFDNNDMYLKPGILQSICDTFLS